MKSPASEDGTAANPFRVCELEDISAFAGRTCARGCAQNNRLPDTYFMCDNKRYETRQTPQGSIRESVQAAASSAHGRGISQTLCGCKKSGPIRFGVRTKEIGPEVSGTRRCANSERAPNSKHGGLSSMSQAPTNLSPDQWDAIERTYVTIGIVVVFLETIAGKLQEPDDRLLAMVNTDSSKICQRRLLGAFPELHLQGRPSLAHHTYATQT